MYKRQGYVGAYPYAEVKSGYTSFFLGARSVCPSATMEVTFTYSWYDEAMEKEGAQMLIQKGCVLISQIAEDYGMSAKALNKLLHEEGVQYNMGGQWLLYKEHQNKGLTRSETVRITRSDGRPDTVIHTKWTQKGRLYINQILEKRGIVARMDRE